MTNEQINEKLQNRRFKHGYNPPKEDLIFSITQGQKVHTIGNLQSIVCFQGLPKAGKSSFITTCISSAFTTWDFFGMKLNFPPNRKRLCFIDTESSESDYYNTLNRIKSQMLCDPLPHNFDSFLFREDAPSDIIHMINVYLEQNLDCSILVIDGILDLIADFNSVDQSFYLIQWLKNITKKYNILVLCVLHLGKKDQNSIGHIGSFLDRKSQSVLKVSKNKEKQTIDLEPHFLRSSDDFDPIRIMNQQGNFVQINDVQIAGDEKISGIEKTRIVFNLLPEPKVYTQMLDDLSEMVGKGKTTCKGILKNWINEGLIVKKGNVYQKK
jgi:hypothetical protein